MTSFVLVVAAVYQLLRFSTLFLAVSSLLRGTAATGVETIVLALAAPALIVAVLMIQFAVTAAPAVLAPLRVAALLQLVGAVVLFVRAVRSVLPVTLFVPGAVPALAAFIAFVDFVILLYLLLYDRGAEDS